MKKIIGLGAAFVAAVTLGGGAALAAVTFDVGTGTGFVGKGDVQLAFGWNNAGLQRNATAVTFSYDAVDTYTAICTFTTGDGTPGERVHNVDHKKSTGIAATLDGDPRQVKGQKQFTGFILKGYLGEPQTVGGAVPVVDGPCPGNQGHDGVWSSVELTSSTGGLYATFDGVSAPLQ